MLKVSGFGVTFNYRQLTLWACTSVYSATGRLRESNNWRKCVRWPGMGAKIPPKIIHHATPYASHAPLPCFRTTPVTNLSLNPKLPFINHPLARQRPPAVHMDAGTSPARQARARHRHELRTLSYVTLDQANGGIIRNLSDRGIGVQVVAAVRPRQQLRVRFELRYPRLQVETRAEVVWATFSGQCGIRFLDLPDTMRRQVNQWIFGNLLEGISLHTEQPGSIFAPIDTAAPRNGDSGNGHRSIAEAELEDGLMVSPSPVKVIELPPPRVQPSWVPPEPDTAAQEISQLDWLSQPLSGRTLAWTVDTLIVIAAMLLFTLIFLSVAGEAPRWPLAVASAACLMMSGLYWAFFRLFAGASLGAKLARLTEPVGEDEGRRESRFR